VCVPCPRHGCSGTDRKRRSQNRTPIQILDDAKDAIQTLHIRGPRIITGSVDGHVRTYDLRMGQLRADNLGRAAPPLLPRPPPADWLAQTR
jgi:mitogen-activated protein kinase organizer 1